jgi:hypothetical protein
MSSGSSSEQDFTSVMLVVIKISSNATGVHPLTLFAVWVGRLPFPIVTAVLVAC